MLWNRQLIISIIILLLLLVLGLVLIRFFFKKKKTGLSTAPSMEFLEGLVKAIGTTSNIRSVSREHQRIKLIVSDLKVVSGEQLKQLGTPAFLKGKELTLLVKHHTKDVIDYINTLKREGN